MRCASSKTYLSPAGGAGVDVEHRVDQVGSSDGSRLLRRASDIVVGRAAMAGNEGGWIDPAARIVTVAGADKRRRELAHLEMQMRPISSMRGSHRGDLLTAWHLLFRFHQDFVDMRVVRLHVFPHAVFFVGMEQNDYVAPSRPAFARKQDAAIGDRIDWIAQVAVLTADAV